MATPPGGVKDATAPWPRRPANCAFGSHLGPWPVSGFGAYETSVFSNAPVCGIVNVWIDKVALKQQQYGVAHGA